jgi:NAD(P)-dependent dehydrogenase (short-subunit alcohol dehydrogenase family)
MGLAVASALATRGGWHLHLLNMGVERSEETAESLGSNVKFHKANVTINASLASIFDNIF